MKLRHAVAVYAAAALPVAAQAEPFGLKGYELGAPMTACPDITIAKGVIKGVTQCWLGETTLADEPATDLILFLVGGKVAGATVKMKGKGLDSNAGVRAALTAKYGEPNTNRSHLGEYRWQQGSASISLDTINGTIVAQDLAAMREAERQAAEKSKSDL